jgi:hypothetical protein
MFPTIPARTGAHHVVEMNRKLPAMKSIKAKNTRVRLLPIRSATKLTLNVYRALENTVAVRTTPMSNELNPSWDR